MIVSVALVTLALLIAQAQHYAFIKSNKSEVDKTELDELKSKVEALRVAQGFKR